MTIASLPMYDLPELREATNAWWAGLAEAFRRAGIKGVPETLERGGEMADPWHSPHLLFSQTCGYPLTHALAGLLQPLATPCYAVPGCEGARYSSAIVVRTDDSAHGLDDLRGRVCAVNGAESQSGYNTLRHSLAPLAEGARFFADVVVTGGHAASLAAVAAGRADVAAVDCVTFALLSRSRPAAVAGLRVLDWSEAAPGLPYVTRADADAALLRRLRAGLMNALADPDLAEPRDALCLCGAEVLPIAEYGCIDRMEAEAIAHGYPRIA